MFLKSIVKIYGLSNIIFINRLTINNIYKIMFHRNKYKNKKRPTLIDLLAPPSCPDSYRD